MMTQKKLSDYFEQTFSSDLLVKARQVDERMANGLQVAGKKEIKKIVTGVSISSSLIEQAVAKQADALLVHHGLDLSFPYNLMLPYQQQRQKLLFEHELNLYGFHYCLDAHQDLGHNAVLAKKLKAKIVKPYFDNWGWIADLPKPVKLEQLAAWLKKIVDHDVFVVQGQDQAKVVKRLGLITGRGIPRHKQIVQLLEDRVEVHITGEISEWNVFQFMELDTAYLACGHYASESLGVKALTGKMKHDLKGQVEVEFIDLYNPV